MALTSEQRLRQLLGEKIPPGGDETDTLFTDEEVADFLARADEDLNRALYYGWEAKAAALSDLVDTSEGSSRRNLSSAAERAEKQKAYYGKLTGLSSTSRSVVMRRITRP